MLQRLKTRRFKAIFEYLDSAQAGVVDLPLLASQESVMQSLDPAVREDVARAAALVAAKVRLPANGNPVSAVKRQPSPRGAHWPSCRRRLEARGWCSSTFPPSRRSWRRC